MLSEVKAMIVRSRATMAEDMAGVGLLFGLLIAALCLPVT